MCSKPSPIHEAKPRQSVSSPLLSLDAFEDGLDRYGADFSCWPGDLRAEAERLAAHSSAAKAALADAVLVDDFLASRSEAGSQSDLVDRIMARQRALAPAGVPNRHAGLRHRWPSVLGPTLLCVACVLFGAAAGFMIVPTASTYDVSGVLLLTSDTFYM